MRTSSRSSRNAEGDFETPRRSPLIFAVGAFFIPLEIIKASSEISLVLYASSHSRSRIIASRVVPSSRRNLPEVERPIERVGRLSDQPPQDGHRPGLYARFPDCIRFALSDITVLS